jgi:ATP-dependent Clp protease protease subunit
MKLDKEDEINIFINSPGGSVMEGLKIVSYIEMLNKNVKVNCIADFAASMAFIITQSCKNRFALKSSILMQHQMSLMNKGNLFNLNNYMDMINDMNVDLDKSQAERINISYEEFKERITNDWWLYGNKAKELNVVDNIVNVRCSDRLTSRTEKIKISTFFGDVEFTFNLCPLIRHPLKVKFNREFEDLCLDNFNHDTFNTEEFDKYNNYFNSESYYNK